MQSLKPIFLQNLLLIINKYNLSDDFFHTFNNNNCLKNKNHLTDIFSVSDGEKLKEINAGEDDKYITLDGLCVGYKGSYIKEIEAAVVDFLNRLSPSQVSAVNDEDLKKIIIKNEKDTDGLFLKVFFKMVKNKEFNFDFFPATNYNIYGFKFLTLLLDIEINLKDYLPLHYIEKTLKIDFLIFNKDVMKLLNQIEGQGINNKRVWDRILMACKYYYINKNLKIETVYNILDFLESKKKLSLDEMIMVCKGNGKDLSSLDLVEYLNSKKEHDILSKEVNVSSSLSDKIKL